MSDPSDDTIELRADPRDERVDELPRERRRKPWVKGAIAAIVLIIFGAGTWYAYSIGMRTGSEGAAPLIRADQRPSKVRPDDPGGMKVPHQDKTIFDRVKPADDSKKVEQLLPPPEEPVARPKKQPQQAAAPAPPSAAPPTPAPAAAPTPAPEAKAPAADAKTPPPEPAPPTAAQLAAPPPLATAPTPAPQAAPKPAETPKTVAASPAPTAAVPAKNGSYKVQIASVPSQELAEKEWAKAKAANSDLLGALTMSIQRADLGAKGIYYRVQAGPLADDAAAKTLCSSLQSRKIGCLVVRP
ncbi:MAG: SPOR domain-containing protein [Alphaproteobacteria bacterium]